MKLVWSVAVSISLLPFLALAEPVEVEGQPIAANVIRLINSLDFLGAPLDADLTARLLEAAGNRDFATLQNLLDPHVLAMVSLNPEVRVKASRGSGKASLQQHGYTPVIIKVLNQSTSTAALNLSSPQSGAVYAGEADLSMRRQAQLELKSDLPKDKPIPPSRFLDLSIYGNPPPFHFPDNRSGS